MGNFKTLGRKGLIMCNTATIIQPDPRASQTGIKTNLCNATPDQLIRALQEKINDLPFCDYDRLHKKSEAYGSNYIRHEAIEREASKAMEIIIDTFMFFKGEEL